MGVVSIKAMKLSASRGAASGNFCSLKVGLHRHSDATSHLFDNDLSRLLTFQLERKVTEVWALSSVIPYWKHIKDTRANCGRAESPIIF